MLKVFYTISAGLFLLSGCGGSVEKDDRNNVSSVSKAVPVYNQAYQENYTADTVADIIVHAKNAYVLIDPFEDEVYQHIQAIRTNNNQVAGYISAGTGEDWRGDFIDLKPYLTTKVWSQWEGEYFVSKTTTGILDVMKKRIDKMGEWGVNWVEFDNMDWLDEESRVAYELNATVAEAKEYINALCDYTHSKGMKCMAKNTVEGFEDFDGVLYESYNNNKNWWDIQGTKTFLNEGKLVIINHYNESDCTATYNAYKRFYSNDGISFICEDAILKKYRHYNE